MSSAALLTVEHLTVRYGEAIALADVDLEVHEGGAVAVLGPNGAGKTSLASAIAGVVRVAAGRVVFAGRDITRLSSPRVSRLGIAYVPEERGIFPHLTVADNLRVQLRHAVPRRQRGAAIERAFDLFPVLRDRRRQSAGTLSGGEQQMLGLARVLAAPPRLLIADELSLGLAPMLVDVVFDTLARVRAEGVSVLLIEQYVERAVRFADDAVILRRGEIAWRGKATDARSETLAGYLGDAPPPPS